MTIIKIPKDSPCSNTGVSNCLNLSDLGDVDQYVSPNSTGSILISNGNEWVNIENAPANALEALASILSSYILNDPNFANNFYSAIGVTVGDGISGSGSISDPITIDSSTIPSLT